MKKKIGQPVKKPEPGAKATSSGVQTLKAGETGSPAKSGFAPKPSESASNKSAGTGVGNKGSKKTETSEPKNSAADAGATSFPQKEKQAPPTATKTATTEAKPSEPRPAVDKSSPEKSVPEKTVNEKSSAKSSSEKQGNEKPGNAAQFLSDYDIYLLREGRHLKSYEKMGAQLTDVGGKRGVHFAVWAPNASKVSVVGDFNAWDGNRNAMSPVAESGIWSVFVAGVAKDALYKFEIHDRNGNLLPLKADPYAFSAEQAPQTASRVYPLPKAKETARSQTHKDAISIYEVHLGSWRRGDHNRFLSYKELAKTLIPYVKEMGFTHVEFMPISEHPFEGSWGYQPIGLFAPTSRFGTPDEFKEFVEEAHKENIGVLVDWVPGHFPNDVHGLADFDGTHLYEHQDPREGKHQDWGTLIYNFGRTEVANFLLSNAHFWMDRYGVDGLRVDAVASMIYRNYSRKEGEWVPNIYGGVENLEATGFLRSMNETVFGSFPHATTIAEESTAFTGVSRPVYSGGLGFGFKWNMGWMHDTLKYMSEDPINRKYHHSQLTFGLLYAYSENFVLPLSHDEVVHGKGSIIGRMPGDEWQRFANLRAYYGFMYCHPGKKLLFMGNEIAQYAEWNHNQSLDWHLLEFPLHLGVQTLVKDLNHLYRNTPSLYQRDTEPSGFEWIESQSSEDSVLSFLRRGDDDSTFTVVVCNFTPVVRYGYRIGVPEEGYYEEKLNTDSAHYGGSNVGNGGGVHSEPQHWSGRPHSLVLTLPPLSTVAFTFQRKK